MSVTTIADKIEENAKSPARVTVSDTTVEGQSIPDQILAEQHLAAKSAIAKNHLGLTFRQFTPGGCG